MADELYVGIDVGGTSGKIGVMTKEGDVVAKAGVLTPPLVDEAGYTAVTDGVKSVLEGADVDASLLKGIGLAVPCPVPADGNISVIANLSLNLLGVHDALQASFPGVYVGFLNDANAAAMGELWRGAGADLHGGQRVDRNGGDLLKRNSTQIGKDVVIQRIDNAILGYLTQIRLYKYSDPR